MMDVAHIRGHPNLTPSSQDDGRLDRSAGCEPPACFPVFRREHMDPLGLSHIEINGAVDYPRGMVFGA